MKSAEENYLAFKKLVIQDFPYEVDWNDTILKPIFLDVHEKLKEQHSHINESYYSRDGVGLIRLEYIDHYIILAYRYSNALWKAGLTNYADIVYYSNRVRGNLDLFYKAEFGDYLMCVHALGAVLDCHATYGNLFSFYNGIHVGPYSIVGKEPSEWIHPVFGDYVTLLSGAKVYGKTVIGNNVIVSPNTVIINEEIPDNCIVSGISPNLYFMKLRVPNSSILK
jgi:serine O-acetyltransferase